MTMTQRKGIVVTIDGPAGAGKSTVAKSLARRLKFSYLDTGAMYRALTLKAMTTGCDLQEEASLAALAKKTTLLLMSDPVKGTIVLMDGKNVSEAIRTPEVTNNTFYIARAPKVREVLVDLQRKMGQRQNIVVEGRDAGTVVFPDANFKFYLDANFEERARRRIAELREKGQTIADQDLKKELQDRDYKDQTRKAGPLKKAVGAILIDSTDLTIEQVVDKMMEAIEKKA